MPSCAGTTQSRGRRRVGGSECWSTFFRQRHTSMPWLGSVSSHISLLQLEDQRREPRRSCVVQVVVAREAALQVGAVVALQARLCSMALQAQGLQLLLLSGQELGDRNDVIDLEGPQSDAQFAHALLAGQQLFPSECPRAFFGAGSGQELSATGHAQALRF